MNPYCDLISIVSTHISDIQAYALMAISCRTLSNQSTMKEWLLLKKDVARNITEWQQADGSFGNVYSTGLALQVRIPLTIIPKDSES